MSFEASSVDAGGGRRNNSEVIATELINVVGKVCRALYGCGAETAALGVNDSMLVSIVGMALYTGYVFMPQHIMAILHYFEIVQ
ncbi:PREDICTED: serine palmitoyltransferase small subunit A [Nipponia nippon]|uniref:serine palmitoyltransferase small subunit A n=1 Tax=Nipponia nippon TaxID=128390 RepID=UPI000511B360|nr:PREDICTED: serine palmitoyltransferase small subunit A [Nipponia nippon]